MTNCNGKPCYSTGFRTTNQGSEDCPGRLAEEYFGSEVSWGEEGCIVHVCPNPAYADRGSSAANYCGNGPDVLVLYGSEAKSRDELQKELVDHLEDF